MSVAAIKEVENEAKAENFLPMKRLLKRTGYSDGTIYGLIKQGKFPKAHTKMNGISVWREVDIEAWEELRDKGDLKLYGPRKKKSVKKVSKRKYVKKTKQESTPAEKTQFTSTQRSMSKILQAGLLALKTASVKEISAAQKAGIQMTATEALLVAAIPALDLQ